MEEEKPPSSPIEEASIDEAFQRRIRAYQRAEGVSFLIAVLILVIAAFLLLTHLTIVRLLAFRLLVSQGPMLLLETFQHWSPWRAMEAEPSVLELQHQQFVRQAGSFAVEVNSLSKRLSAIIQEARSGITPFRLEGSAGGSKPAQAPDFSVAEQPASSRSSGKLTSTW